MRRIVYHYVYSTRCGPQAIESQHDAAVFREVWSSRARLVRREVLRTLSRISAVEDRERKALLFDAASNENPFVVMVMYDHIAS